jgi:ribose transport system permease protein
MAELRRLLRTQTFMFALVVAVVLFAANAVALPNFVQPVNWPRTLAVFAPFAVVAIAATPAIMSGGGGIDLSVGPLANLANVVFVLLLIPAGLGSPAISIPILLGIGLLVGTVNGILIAVLRYQPVIATLCALFVVTGVNLKLLSAPISAQHNWTEQLSGTVGPVPGALLILAVPVVVWLTLRRTPYHRTLLAVGGDDATALSAGVNVVAVRVIAYALGGAFSAVAGIALTVLLQSADPNLGGQYVLIAIAAVVLGGTPLGGGRGGILGSILGAAIIYLVQNLLASLHVSSLWLQVVYGTLLLVGVVVGAVVTAPPRVLKSRQAA